jgi:undecaprenyl diphosphate synthase
MQSTRSRSTAAGLHLAIIMDGNGRWAAARGLPRSAGHAAGVEAMRRIVTAARARGLGTLTLFAFSSDNWERPREEVDALMRLLREGLEHEVERCVANGVRLSIIGRRDRLTPGVTEVIGRAEEATRGGRAMRLRVALDYSARAAILGAARLCAARTATPEEFESLLGLVLHDPEPVHAVDLLIRTGGEQRLSDFLLWECAYAELWFSERMWPEFSDADLDAALAEFCRRERRFGRLPRVAESGAAGGA